MSKDFPNTERQIYEQMPTDTQIDTVIEKLDRIIGLLMEKQ